MTQSGNGQSWFGAWPGFLAALLLTVGAVLVQSPLRPDRPADVSAGLPALGEQDVDARLWQDPFAAVDKVREGTGKEGTEPATQSHNIAWLADQILARPTLKESAANQGSAADEAPRIEVLAILVGGGPSIGSAELRRRDRYAVLSGLMLERFLPDDPEHIGYQELGDQSPPAYIPFEWFSSLPGDASRKRPRRDLLLLWIDQGGLMQPTGKPPASAATQPTAPDPSRDVDAEAADAETERHDSGQSATPEDNAQDEQTPTTASGPHILARLSRLFSKILAHSNVPVEHIRFSVIGPRDSTGLQAIAAEYALSTSATTAVCEGQRTTPARMWSPFATIPDVTEIPEQPHGVCECASSGETNSPQYCVPVVPPGRHQRPIADDGVLVNLLVDELRRRHVGSNSGVALVGQWDTAYSRTLARRFKSGWQDVHDVGQRRGHERRVFRFSYMRGLDGAIPGEKAPSSNDDQGKRSAQAIERAAGDAQLDYLRRMKQALLDKHTQLRADCTLGQRFSQDCGIRAIGVLGNDYFDKLLVLKALKPVFGNAIFFTTDLDADMLHPEDNAVTRNLIVASGFGLSLKRGLQREVPPLRDSYQTALLLAVHLALSSRQHRDLAIPPPARLFEVGRTRMVELVTDSNLQDAGGFLRPAPQRSGDKRPQTSTSADRDPHPQDELNAHYRALSGQASAPLVALAVALLLTPALLGLILGPDRVARTLGPWWKGLTGSPAAMGAAALTLAAVVLLAGGAWWDIVHGGEPLSFLQGVSVWPAEALRLVAGLAAVAFLVTGHRRLCRERVEIERDFRLEPDGQWLNDGEPLEPEPSVEAAPQPPSARLAEDATAADPEVRRTKSAGIQAARTASGMQMSGLPSSPGGCAIDLPDRSPATAPSSPAEIWRRYVARCRVLPRWMVPKDLRDCLTQRLAPGWDHHSVTTRLTIQGMLFFLLALALMVALGFPSRPTRSDLAWQIDFATIIVVLVPFLGLLFYVIDATRQTLILAGELAGPVRWPEETLARFGLAHWSRTRDGKAANPGDVDWLDVRLIARVSRAVGDLVWYPVLVLIVLALARHPMFDSLDLPPALAILMTVVLLCVIVCAWTLRRAAERVRATALRNLQRARLCAQAETDSQSCIAQLDALLKAVADEREGAFRPFNQQPVVHALLTLASSVSGLALIEYSSIINL